MSKMKRQLIFPGNGNRLATAGNTTQAPPFDKKARMSQEICFKE